MKTTRLNIVTIGIEAIALDICKQLVRQGRNFKVTRERAGSVADGIKHLRDHWRFEVEEEINVHDAQDHETQESYDACPECSPKPAERRMPEWGGPE